MTSLRRDLSVSLTLILVVVFLFLWASLSFAINKVAEDQLLMHLEHDGDSLVTGLSLDASGNLQLTEAVMEEVYRHPGSGHYFTVRTGNGRLLKSPSLGSNDLSTPTLQPGHRTSRRIDGPNHQTVLILARGIMVDGKLIQVLVGEDLGPMSREVKEQSLAVLLLIVPLLAAAVVLQGWMISRALRPLARVHQALRQIGRGEVNQIDLEAPDEIRPLVDELNRLLVLVSRRLVQSRTAIGNLAHALKTPLAMLFRVADDGTLPKAIREMLQDQTSTIHGRIERELKRARLSGGDAGGGNVNLRAELDVMVKVLASIYREKNLEIEIHAPDAGLPYDREDLLELIGNLADNACKWAQGKVWIEVEEQRDGAGLRIRVADDGPGCAEETHELLTTRGLRLDESKDGHGLGLAICHEIVSFYGGRMTLTRDALLGGLEVTIELPRRSTLV